MREPRIVHASAMHRAASIAIALVLASAFGPASSADECSTAVIGGAASVDGRPILWKNRDTDHLRNKVVFVDESPCSYLGVVDADDASGRRVYVGLNAAGFAIMNTVAYNLPMKPDEAADQEGAIMADALRLCRTADDFEEYLKENTGRELGSRANFGVIDAVGGAAVFEVHNNGYDRIDAADTPGKHVLVTNFSRSGEADEGRGYVRFERLTELFRDDGDGKYAFDQVLGTFARDMRNPYVPGLDRATWSKLPADKPSYLYTQQTIDRGSTASAIVIHGVAAGGAARDATMWVILGEPVCGIAVPLWVEAGEVPPELGGSGPAPINEESMRLKGLLRPFKDPERVEYADVSKLANRSGTGWLDILVRTEDGILERTKQFLAANPGAPDKARFQRQIAAEVLETLKGIR
jgi:hypothetical protein